MSLGSNEKLDSKQRDEYYRLIASKLVRDVLNYSVSLLKEEANSKNADYDSYDDFIIEEKPKIIPRSSKGKLDSK